MRGISGINRNLPSSWQMNAIYDDMRALWQELDAQALRSRVSPENRASWSYRDVRPAISALPLLADAGLGFQRNKLSYQNPGQMISQGLSDIFMAYDRFRREQLFAKVTEDQAERRYTQELFLDEIQDLANRLHHSCMMAELISRMIASELETGRQIIRNI